MSWNGNAPRGSLVKRRQSTATGLGSRFAKALAAGRIIDRNQKQPNTGPRKKIAVPEGLAKFFTPLGGA